ncbi:MAG: single-stranded DNA-binding protein [Caldimicrobium sp.]|jgi:single-strand DNA-binding protein
MLNKVMLIGRLGGDPEIRFTVEGKAVCILNLATNEVVVRGEGKEVITEWHRVVLFGKLAEAVASSLSKGDRLYVEGRIRSREYEDKNGVKKRAYEIFGNKVIFLGGKVGDKVKGEVKEDVDREGMVIEETINDDEIPF